MSQIVLYAFNYPPANWQLCNGDILAISQYSQLFSLLGTKFGGDGLRNFALPDFRALAPPDLTYCIALQGAWPSRDGGLPHQVAAELSLAAMTFTLGENAACNGQLLFVEEYPELAALLGTRFGGEGTAGFGVPNLTTLAPKGSAYNIALSSQANTLATPFIGEIRLFATVEIPSGWEACEGQSVAITSNEKLYSLIGIKFGGDQTNFLLPNLQGIAEWGTQFCIATAGDFPNR